MGCMPSRVEHCRGESLVTGEGRSFLQRVGDEDPISVQAGARRGYIEYVRS